MPEDGKTPGRMGRAWAEVDLDALDHNAAALRALLPPGCQLMPAVKAEAYGHGAVPVARELNRLGVDAFCVATAEEGARLRRGGVRGDILVLGYTHPSDFPLLTRYDLVQTVVDGPFAGALEEYGKPVRVHIGVDTGMRRLGFPAEEPGPIAGVFRRKNLRVEGVFTHLCAADTCLPRDRAFTLGQAGAFRRLIEELEDRGCAVGKTHLLSSYGLLNYPRLGGSYARVGIALYGEGSTRADTERWKDLLRPVLSVKARVASVRTLRPGEYAGYGLAFQAREETRIAALAIGYADGFPRSLSNGAGRVLLHGRGAPVVGRVCMDQTMVDVSHIPQARAGDAAVVIGSWGDETIRASETAEAAGTITNELLSRLGPRLERIPVRGQSFSGSL